MKDEAGMWRGVAILRGEDGEEGVQHVLQELDQLLPASPHDPSQDIRDPVRQFFKFPANTIGKGADIWRRHTLNIEQNTI